jgi:competence protein ComEC
VNRLAGTVTGRRLVVLAGGFAIGTAAGYATHVAVGVVLAVAAATAAVVLIALNFEPIRVTAGLVLATLLVALLGAARGSVAVHVAGPGDIDAYLGARSVVLTAVVRSASPASASEAIVDVGHLSDTDTDRDVSGGLLVTGTRLPRMAPGDRVEVQAPALRPPGRRPGPQSEATLEREDVYAVAASAQVTVLAPGTLSPARVIAAVQSGLAGAVNQALPQPAAALLLGIAFGIHQPLAADARAPLQDAGLIHVVVVSGLKVVIVIGLVAAVARVLEWSRRQTLVVAATIVTAYVLVSGAGPAAVRSALMAGAAMLAATGARRTDPLPMLATVAALMLGIQPQLVEDPGFQLSFLGTAGILFLTAPIARHVPGPRLLVEPFATTVAAQLATVPVMAGTFGVIALAGPIANALVLPMLPGLIVAGGAGAALGSVHPALGWLPLQLSALGVDVIVAIAGALTAIPGAAIHLGVWPPGWTVAALCGLVAAGALLLRRARGSAPHQARANVAVAAATGLIAATCAGVIGARPDGLLHMTVLNLGSAPAVLVQTGAGGVALVDGGSSPAALLQAIGRVLPPTTRRIDMVVLTGGEQTAVAGLSSLPSRYSVSTVIVPGALPPAAQTIVSTLQAAGANVVEMGGGAWRWGDSTWRCLHFLTAASGRPMCAVTISESSGTALLLGDAGGGEQDEISATYAPLLRADVIVTPPGGAVSAPLLSVAHPAELAVPLAKGGHATASPPGISARRTGVDGDLQFVGGPGGLAAAA